MIYSYKLNFTIEARFIQKTKTSTTGDTIQLKTQVFLLKEDEPNFVPITLLVLLYGEYEKRKRS